LILIAILSGAGGCASWRVAGRPPGEALAEKPYRVRLTVQGRQLELVEARVEGDSIVGREVVKSKDAPAAVIVPIVVGERRAVALSDVETMETRGHDHPGVAMSGVAVLVYVFVVAIGVISFWASLP